MTDPSSSTDIPGQADPAFAYTELRRMLRDSYKGQHLWSFGNGMFTVVIVTFSAIAAVLAQVKEFNLLFVQLDAHILASVFSVIVTIVSTIQTKMGFERKWAANRATQSALRQLRIDEAAGRPRAEIEATLKKIISTHDQAIIEANT